MARSTKLLALAAVILGVGISTTGGVTFVYQWLALATGISECGMYGTSIVALTNPQVLYLCTDGKTTDRFSYSAGWHGFGKTKEGDKKTPIGTYSLAKPRPSSEFGTYIEVGYPNAEDIGQHRTGGDIGIHGPKRGFAILGWANLLVNWTAGCLAVRSDENIRTIARWLKDNPRGSILHIVQRS